MKKLLAILFLLAGTAEAQHVQGGFDLGSWATWSPAVTCGTGTITTLGTVTARYKALGKTISFEVVVPITTAGTCATQLNVPLPTTPNSAAVAVGRETAVSGAILQGSIIAANGTMTAFKYDNTWVPANGWNIVMAGTYESQ